MGQEIEIYNFPDPTTALPRSNQRKNAVIRTDKKCCFTRLLKLSSDIGLNNNPPPASPDSRIDNDEMNRPVRKKSGSFGKYASARADIAGRYEMVDINKLRSRRKRENHALHLGEVRIGKTEISGKSNYPTAKISELELPLI
jgi:hypothetical protein